MKGLNVIIFFVEFQPSRIHLPFSYYAKFCLSKNASFFFTKLTQVFIALCQNISGVFQQLYSDLCYRGLRLDRYGNCSSILQRIDFRATDLFPV